jgi:adenosylcobinamide-GDP ribazoletransferase
MAGYFPLLGLTLGLILALVWLILGALSLSGSFNAIIVVIALAILTRGFHLDGLADTADALLSHRSVEEKLAILKDCHLGTFGVAAIVLDLLLKISLITEMMTLTSALVGLILAPVWGRLAASVVAVKGTYARSSGGLAHYVVDGAGSAEFRLAALSGLIISLLAGLTGLITAFGVLALGFFLAYIWRKALGGVTGDLLGATVEIGEIAALLIYVLLNAKP